MKEDYVPLIVGGVGFPGQPVLIGFIISSAAIPTFFAQRWFTPKHDEDLVETNGDAA